MTIWYAILLSIVLSKFIQFLLHKDWSRASGYALASIWVGFGFYLSTFWNA